MLHINSLGSFLVGLATANPRNRTTRRNRRNQSRAGAIRHKRGWHCGDSSMKLSPSTPPSNSKYPPVFA